MSYYIYIEDEVTYTLYYCIQMINEVEGELHSWMEYKTGGQSEPELIGSGYVINDVFEYNMGVIDISHWKKCEGIKIYL